MPRPRRDPASIPVHWLRANHRVWTPADVAFFDCETHSTTVDGGELLRPSLWVGLARQRRTKNKNLREDAWRTGTDPAGFADWLDGVGRRSRTTWAFAHNLAFDATALHIPVTMRRHGWRLTDFSTSDGAPFFRLSLVDHSILLTDSWSWLPKALGTIAETIGMAKAPLPETDTDAEGWMARCRGDVDVLATAVCDLMDWWDREDLGNWSLTGAGCGWNAFRHKAGDKRVLIDPDPAARAFERRALYGGRRESFRIGELPRGRYLELDLKNAYPTAAAHYPLPMKRVRGFDTLPLDHSFLRAPNYGVIAEVVVNLDQPRVPLRWRRQVFYPVGRFRTVLASPELEPLIAAGAVESIGRGYAYRTGMVMADWARWVIPLANGEDETAPPVAALAAKHWSRAVIGKWATRSTQLEQWGPAPTAGWALEEAWHAELNCPASIVDIAGTRWCAVKDLEGENAFPAVTVWVESLVRRALTAAIEAVPPNLVLSCDTDGLLFDDSERATLTRTVDGGAQPRSGLLAAAEGRLEAAQAAALPFRLVEKGAHDQVTILGPVHWRAPGVRHYSGVRGDATETAPDTFSFLTWPKLSWQLAHGRAEAYVRSVRTMRITGPYTHRWVLADGTTAPPTAGVDDTGESQLGPYSTTSAAAAGYQLAETQHSLLAPLAGH